MSTVTSHVPGTPCWLDLATPDAAAARAFYADLFGWTYDIGGPEMGFYSMAKLDGRHVGGIGQPPPDMQMPPAWTPYLSVEDAEATLAAVQAHGGKLVFGPMEIPGSGVQVVCADPTGAVFGFWQARPFVGAGVLDEPGSLAWAEVNTPKATVARDFYATVFGLEAAAIGGEMEYYTLAKNGTMRCGVLQMTAAWGDLPPHWMVYFAVADTDAAVARVVELGGKMHHAPFDTPYGRMAVVSDPAGAVFSLMKPSQLALES